MGAMDEDKGTQIPNWLQGATPGVRETVGRFAGGYTCSMAVASVFGPRYGVDADLLARAATGFSGGLGGLGGTCGAVAGAVMVLGLAHTPADLTDRVARQDTWELVRRYVADFEREAGSARCADLIGCDLSSAGAVCAARDRGAFARVCPPLVALAARLLEQYLDPGPGTSA